MSQITFFAYKINAVVNVRIVKIYTMLVKLTANGLQIGGRFNAANVLLAVRFLSLNFKTK